MKKVFVMRNGRLVRASLPVRVRDNVNLRSLGAGVVPHQIPGMLRDLGRAGIKGVSFDPETGEALMRDRATKLKYLKYRKYHDEDEVCG